MAKIPPKEDSSIADAMAENKSFEQRNLSNIARELEAKKWERLRKEAEENALKNANMDNKE